jgi:hypothetical protein
MDPVWSTFSRFASLSAQSLELGLIVLFIYAENLFAGWGLSLFLLPRWYLRRWWVIMPVIGVSLQSVLLLAASRAGFSVRQFSPVIISIITLLTVLSLFKARKLKRAMRFQRAALRANATKFMIGLLIIPTSTAIITNLGRRSIWEIWGVDINVYTLVADYLLGHGGTAAAYRAQSEYITNGIYVNIVEFARISPMSLVAFFASLLKTRAVHLVNPIIVFFMVLQYLACVLLAERFRYRSSIVLFCVAFHPFLYFLLFFTYFSQAMSTTIATVGFLLMADCLPGSKNRAAAPMAVMAGFVQAAALLSYPPMLPVQLCFYTFATLRELFKSRLRASLARLLTIGSSELLITSFYLPNVFSELRATSRMNPAAGWTWRSFIGASELLGISTVLSTDGRLLPLTRLRDRIELETLLLILMVFGFIYTLRRSKDALVFASLVCASLAVCTISVYRHRTGVINANHGFAKALSQFAVFLLFPIVIALDHVVRRRLKSPALFFALILAIVVFQLNGLTRARHLDSWYTEDLITLVRDDLKDAELIAFKGGTGFMGDSIIQNVSRMRFWNSLDVNEVKVMDHRTVLVLEGIEPPFPASILHRRGKYIAVRPIWREIP